MKKFISFIDLNGIFLALSVAIVFGLFKTGANSNNDALTIAGFVCGLLLILVIALKEPVMFAVYKMRVRDFIDGETKPFIKVNSANSKVLALIPNIDEMKAKHIVYNRRHLGKFKTAEDFFVINQIPEDKREEISKYIII